MNNMQWNGRKVLLSQCRSHDDFWPLGLLRQFIAIRLLLQILQQWPIPKGLIPSSSSTQSIPNFVIHWEISIMLESFFEVGRNNKTELNLKGTKKRKRNGNQIKR